MKKYVQFLLFLLLSFTLVACVNDSNKIYTVNFFDGDEIINSLFLTNDELLKKPIDPNKENFEFLYWEKDGKEFIGFDQSVDESFDLFAKWKELDPNNINIKLLSYYQGFGLENLTDHLFREKLNEILNENVSISKYKSSTVGRQLRVIDEVINKPGYIYTIYDGENMKHEDRGSSGPYVWNNEHVVPQSWFRNSITHGHLTGDLHNLRAANALINSKKGNYPFMDGSGDWFVSGNRFYPGDEHKGDTARIIFYMMIMIPDDNFLSINKIFPSQDGFEVLLKWHLEDPVDEFELKRNELIYNYQNNRNPFIDHPELVYVAWNKIYNKDVNFIS